MTATRQLDVSAATFLSELPTNGAVFGAFFVIDQSLASLANNATIRRSTVANIPRNIHVPWR